MTGLEIWKRREALCLTVEAAKRDLKTTEEEEDRLGGFAATLYTMRSAYEEVKRLVDRRQAAGVRLLEADEALAEFDVEEHDVRSSQGTQ